MQITKEFLKEKNACKEGLNWFLNQSETGLYKLIDKLVEERHENWANWLIVRVMSRQQQLQYAIACAELVLPIFESEYPQDNRPRAAIEAAKKVLEDDSNENRDAAEAAGYVAYAATNAAYAAHAAYAANAAYAAAYAAGYVAYAANAAYAAANAAGYAADTANAANAAAHAAKAAANAANWKQVLQIGINILKGE